MMNSEVPIGTSQKIGDVYFNDDIIMCIIIGTLDYNDYTPLIGTYFHLIKIVKIIPLPEETGSPS